MDPGPAYKRRRPAVACTECRRRKIRCDRHSPCGPCSKSVPSLRCVYNNQPTTRIPETYLDPGMHHMQQHDSVLGHAHRNAIAHEQSIFGQQPFDEVQDMDLFNIDVTPMGDHVMGFVDMDFFGMNDVSHSKSTSTDSTNSLFQGLSRSPSWTTCSLPSTMASSVTNSLQNMPLSQTKSSERTSVAEPRENEYTDADDHENHWFQPFSKCEKLKFLVDSLSGDDLCLSPQQEAIRPLFETYKRFILEVQKARRSDLATNNPAGSQKTARDLLPVRRTCDSLVDTYIKTFESVLRIIHVPSFLRDYENFWEDSASSITSTDETFACKLLLVAALGSITFIPTESQKEQASSCRAQSSNWISHVKDWLARKSMKGMRGDLSMAQIACLLALTRHTHHQDPAPMGVAWLSEGHGLTHMAVQMGLHREPRVRSPNMSVKEAEIRRRLWATMLELSLQVSVDQGLPAPIAPESYDCEVPSSIADDDMVLGVDSQATGHASVLMLLARTQRLRLRILQLVNAPGSSKTYQECYSLASELTTECSSGLAKLQSSLTDFQINLLTSFTKPFVLVLHEAFTEEAYSKPEYYYSRRMRLEISAQLLSPTKEQGPYSALLTNGSGQYSLMQRQATMSLSLDLVREFEEDLFPLLDSGSRAQLRDILSSSVANFKGRVEASRGSESSTEFLLFSCALSYVQILEQKQSDQKKDQSITETLKTVLKFCCDTLEQQRRRASLAESDIWMN
ncbi:activator of stress s 1 [Fusarium beomiforme]|uniref:Activator of stress s 1 n=1 Tax=Fusarium beomiforme TaxID=44412 RepID=A0A9P5DZ47_9HYPO|nr:activator of stress s 1 [Fusarium beomiforme]